MSTLLQSQLATIRLIDKKIDGIRLELYRRGARNLFSAGDWQIAWDRNPELAARNTALFRMRGVAQQTRDAIIESEYQREQRRQRAAQRKASRIAA